VLERLCFGELPPKPHLALRGPEGELRYEACLTRQGFEGPFTIAYHQRPPQALQAAGDPQFSPLAGEARPEDTPGCLRPGFARRHYRTQLLGSEPGGGPTPLLYNADLVLGCRKPSRDDASYQLNAGADELWFVLTGRGTVRTPLGDLDFQAGDYVCIPKGMLFRLLIDTREPQHYLSLEFCEGVGIPRAFRNAVGQLRMDAPYSHRDFKRPRFEGPRDEGVRELWVRSGATRQRFLYGHSPLDVVGWDGSVYPWAFPIRNFQPRVSSVHLPPTWHGTFEAAGALICSFVPRPLDFHPDAVPCPYPHSNVDIDEVLFYVEGDFSSRLGVERGSLSHHPRGVHHGPHPGRYEQSVGARRTDEVAVMLDCRLPLSATRAALEVEDMDYEASFHAKA
jgi:homogentisate 1,2-dioxygenase